MRNKDYILSDIEIEEFDKLYDGNISEEDYYLLMAKLNLDEVLQHKYLVYKLLRKEIEQDGLANKVLKQRFTALDQNLKKNKFRLLSILSSIVFIALITFFFTRDSKNIGIYEKYRESESGISIKMNNLTRNRLDSAMVEIAKGEYDQAQLYLSQLPISDTTLYYKAYCNERLGNFTEASSQYERLVKSNTTIIRQKSRFRLALLKLRSGDKNAISELKRIAKDAGNMYNRTAQEIISSMNKE
jgi:hypothetical protein